MAEFIKCRDDKILDIDSEKDYIFFAVMNDDETYVRSCCLREKEHDIQLIKKEIANYLNSDNIRSLKYRDEEYNDKILIKNTSKNVCKVSINGYSTRVNKADILKNL